MNKFRGIQLLIIGICALVFLSGCTTQTKEERVLEVNKPFNIQTENGNYSITITGIKKTDWWERQEKNNDKTIILLTYEVNNESFKTEYSNGIEQEDQIFTIADQEGYNLARWSSSYSEYSPYVEVTPGTKAKREVPYILEHDTDYVDVSIQGKKGILGTVRVNVEE